ncbi:MAG: protein kinase domain-containing protein [Vicinamibacterales bacterium]
MCSASSGPVLPTGRIWLELLSGVHAVELRQGLQLQMALPPGTRIGSYEVTAQIGAGGMGEVYRATDTKLRRQVALKVLPDAFAQDADRLARFEREARTLASMNHPNIAAIFGLEDAADVHALVMELVEGPTLADQIARGAIPFDEALPIARQVVDALEAAHGQSVIHRDLKPANIKLRPDGVVKVLDFGLAKLVDTSGPDATAGDEVATYSPTLSLAATRAGVILGTAAYMSPEQARGKPVDTRTDIWAFGCVLYEMLTGRRAFGGEGVTDTLASVVRAEPDWNTLPAATPPGTRRLLRRCLRKDPRERLRDVGDARLELAEAEEPPPTVPGSSTQRLKWSNAVVLLAALVAGIGGWLLRSNVAGGASVRTVQVQRLTDLVGVEEAPALSPDGRAVAFVAAAAGGRRQIWVRLVAGGAPLVLTHDEMDHYGPRWSPDSASLIYFTPGAQPGDAGAIWEIPALGGTARRLVNALAPGDLSHDGRSLAFFRFQEGATELAVAARDQSSIRPIARLPTGWYSNLRWSPDDRRLAYIYEGGSAAFSTTLFVVSASGGESRTLADDFYYQGAAWLPDGSGFVVSSAQGSLMSYPPTYNLWTVPLDGGPPAQLTFGEYSYESPDLGPASGLVVSRVRAQSDVWKFPVTGEPAENARNGTRITRQTGLLQTVSVSPDESEVVFLSDNGGHANVWTARVANGEMRPITREFDPRVIVAVPVWSPRGDWINFLSTRNSGTTDVTLWLARPDGSDPRDLGIVGVWACWSGDGQWLYYTAVEAGRYRMRKVRIDSGEPGIVRDDDAIGCSISPDGSALYYAKILTQAAAAWDLELRAASPENGPSRVLGRVSGSRVPSGSANFQALLSPDGRWLAMPLLDGSTTNLWAISTDTGEWRRLTDFGERNVMIARRIAWSRDGRHLYASVSDVDSDVIMLAGLP